MSKDLRNTLIAVALFVALAGVMIYFVTDTQADIETVTKANEDLDNEIKGYNAEIAQAEGLKRQLEELNANFRDYVKILPSAEVATEEKLLKVIQNYMDLAQISIDEVIQKAAGKASGGGKMGEFQEVAVSFRIRADFDSFVRFLNLLERHEQFLKVNSFSVTPGAGGPRTVDGKEVIDLAVAIEVTTYKYIPKK
jgi:Tfp pilus assembly protein PilO